jgi:tetratricopeptide (TPR) repeat protein
MQESSPFIRTTDGAIALANLMAQIDGLTLYADHGKLTSRLWTELVDLLVLRAQILGRVADYECAMAWAERRVRDAPIDGLAFLSQARTRASLHRFEEALTDLNIAERFGVAGVELDAERAAIFQAVGRYDEAMALRVAAAARCADFESLGGLAALHAERGETAVAERLFDQSCWRFRGVSPFALAQLEFQRGHMWQEHGDLGSARDWFAAALRRLPAYVRTEGHLAEVEAGLGEREIAIARLRRLASASDDPDYADQLARILGQDGRLEEAGWWRARAEARYDELMARHPAAFADHAAEFWLTVGGDPRRALGLARQNFEVRRTPRACALLSRTVLACENG